MTDPDRVAAHHEKLDAEVRAHRLAEVRNEQDLTQSEVADIIGITRPDVSRLESGGLDSASPAMLRAYVETLGGKLRVVADFGDRQLLIRWSAPMSPPHRWRQGGVGEAPWAMGPRHAARCATGVGVA